MKKDFLDKLIEKAYSSEKTWEQLANELGIDISEKEIAKPKKQRKGLILRLTSVFASVLLIVGLIVGGLWLFGNTSQDSPRVYSSYDSAAQEITRDYFDRIDQILYFNQDQILNYNYPKLGELRLFREVVRESIEGAGLLLAYAGNDMIYLTLDDRAFLIDFRVRIYRYYEFFGFEGFNNLSNQIIIHGISINYQIFNNTKALISFSYNKIDYFLTVNCFFEEIITTQALQSLLTEIISL